MELIDKRALMYQLHKQSQIDSKPRAIRRARRIVEKYPTVDAIPVQWIEEWLLSCDVTYKRLAIESLLKDWQAEQEKTNEADGRGWMYQINRGAG